MKCHVAGCISSDGSWLEITLRASFSQALVYSSAQTESLLSAKCRMPGWCNCTLCPRGNRRLFMLVWWKQPDLFHILFMLYFTLSNNMPICWLCVWSESRKPSAEHCVLCSSSRNVGRSRNIWFEKEEACLCTAAAALAVGIAGMLAFHSSLPKIF